MMSLSAIIERFRKDSLYYPCLLLAHPSIDLLQTLAEEVIASYKWPVLSIGAVLSQALLSQPPKRRVTAARRELETEVQTKAPSPVFCRDIDILFEPSLHLDPLALLRICSRSARLIVAWPGTYQNETLAYATPTHAHYHTWTDTELCHYCIQNLSSTEILQ